MSQRTGQQMEDSPGDKGQPPEHRGNEGWKIALKGQRKPGRASSQPVLQVELCGVVFPSGLQGRAGWAGTRCVFSQQCPHARHRVGAREYPLPEDVPDCRPVAGPPWCLLHPSSTTCHCPASVCPALTLPTQAP